MLKKLIVIPMLISLSGCASSMHEFYSRAVVEDNIKGTIGTLSLNAQRRTVLVALEGENRGKFCAEPPPDVAENVTTSLEATLEAEIKKIDTTGKGSLKDSLETNIVVLGERTAVLDAYRTGTYVLCQYHLNGALSDEKLQKSFDNLTNNVLFVLGGGKPSQGSWPIRSR